MQFNITQTIVPSVVTLRLKAIQKGFNIRSFDVVLSNIELVLILTEHSFKISSLFSSSLTKY
jgi:hypothetical protein